MNTDIIKTAIKHTIYEFCINIFFDNIVKNFPKKSKRVPEIGERFVKVIDKVNGESYFKCTIIDPKTMDYYDEMEEHEKKDVLMAMYFKWSEFEGDVIDRDESQYFSFEEFKDLKFIK